MKDTYSNYCNTCEVIVDAGESYCPECKKTLSTTKSVKEKVKKEHKYYASIKTIDISCSKCGVKTEIRTTHIDAYTPEVIKKWICPICKMKKDK